MTLNSKYTGALTFEIFFSSLPRRMIEHRTFKTVLEKLDKVHDLLALEKKVFTILTKVFTTESALQVHALLLMCC